MATLPTPVSSSEASQHPEYPSILPLNDTHWAVASGSGSLYILKTTPPTDETLAGALIARYELTTTETSSEPVPFLLQAAHVLDKAECRIIFSRSVTPKWNGSGKAHPTTFELTEVCVNLTKQNAVDGDAPLLEVKWTLQGGDLPVWSSWSGNGWLILSGEEYRERQDGTDVLETEEDRQKRERKEQIEKLGLGASLPDAPTAEQSEAPTESMDVDEPAIGEDKEKEWPLSWKQQGEAIQVTIPLPLATKEKDINVNLSSPTFKFTLSPSNKASPVLASFLAKPARQWWGAIDNSKCIWSFFEGTQPYLQLKLTKVDPYIRWPSLFFPDGDDDDEDEEDVPETIDPAVMAAIRESFTNIRTRTADEPEGNHPAIPALLREEMDYDLEDGEDFGENPTGVFGEPGGGSKVGRDVFVGFIKDGIPTWSKAQTSVVSLPLAGAGMMIKSAVDGLLFDPSTTPSQTPWTHRSTSPALSFVLSSKRDLRLVRHLSVPRPDGLGGSIVFAFDAGGSSSASGNVYVYYPPTSSTTARQGVVRISGAERGALLGVGVMDIHGHNVVVGLCEKDLVVLQGVGS